MTRRIALPIRGLVITSLIAAFAAGGSALLRAQQPAQQPATPAAPAAAPAPPSPPPAEMPKPVTPVVSATAPTPDPRPNLKAGRWDAEQAGWNMRLLSTSPPQGKTLGATHSDLAFSGNLVIQGNYNGFDIYDISNPSKPALVQKYLCPASQNDVSVYRNLVFMSSEATNSRTDCGFEGVPEPVSKLRVRGIRVFDIADIKNPKLVTTVQTCRGSHTHTVVRKAGDDGNVYVYVSGSAGVRSAEEVPGCEDGDIDNPNTARFRLEVIKVPLGAPGEAAVVSSPRVFQDLPVAPRNEERSASDQKDREAAAAAAAAEGRGGAGRGNRPAPTGPPRGPNQCHDITVYSDIGLAGGACGGLGLLLDISDPVNPVRIDEVADANMSFWHSATFNNDGTKVLFSDEWGGGSQPRCRATDKLEWGSNALFTIENKKMKFHSYYKLPAAQSSLENCVAHNGSVIPIPGRDVMVQAWYQGGLSVFDWTDIDHPREIAYFDRGPVDAGRMVMGGSWSAYWYNGVIVSSEIARGLDVYELIANANISENELAAAKTVKMPWLNTQDQPKIKWPQTFVLARAYLDQLERSKGLPADRIKSARSTLASAERRSERDRKAPLTQLASQLNAAAESSSDAAKVRMLATTVSDLAGVQ
jgi:hypothetical protein